MDWSDKSYLQYVTLQGRNLLGERWIKNYSSMNAHGKYRLRQQTFIQFIQLFDYTVGALKYCLYGV